MVTEIQICHLALKQTPPLQKKKERGKGKIANLQESSYNRSSFLDSG